MTKEQLAAYIPHKVRAYMMDFESDYVGREIDTILGIHQWDKTGELWCALTEGGSKPSLDRIKLILKPLSHFEYDHIVQIKEHLGIEKWSDNYDQYFDAWFNDAESVQKLVLQAPYEIMQFFLECHFDVFNLISEKKAIDINTLN